MSWTSMTIFKTRHARYTGLISFACNMLLDNDPITHYAVLYDYRHLRKSQMRENLMIQTQKNLWKNVHISVKVKYRKIKKNWIR